MSTCDSCGRRFPVGLNCECADSASNRADGHARCRGCCVAGPFFLATVGLSCTVAHPDSLCTTSETVGFEVWTR
jgi:hypothetical protein